MLERTHIPEARWWLVEAVDKQINLPARVHNPDYHRGPIAKEMYVPAVY